MEEPVVNKDKDVFENDESIFTFESVDDKGVVTFLIPSESEEVQKAKNEFQWTLESEMFAKFWGLYFMGSVIPDDIWDYVCENQDKITNPSQVMAFRYILGAPIKQNPTVRQMVLAEVM